MLHRRGLLTGPFLIALERQPATRADSWRDRGATLAANVPSPLLSSTFAVPLSRFTTPRSGSPSPFRSAAVTVSKPEPAERRLRVLSARAFAKRLMIVRDQIITCLQTVFRTPEFEAPGHDGD